jgi:hypothetical protein
MPVMMVLVGLVMMVVMERWWWTDLKDLGAADKWDSFDVGLGAHDLLEVRSKDGARHVRIKTWW